MMPRVIWSFSELIVVFALLALAAALLSRRCYRIVLGVLGTLVGILVSFAAFDLVLDRPSKSDWRFDFRWHETEPSDSFMQPPEAGRDRVFRVHVPDGVDDESGRPPTRLTDSPGTRSGDTPFRDLPSGPPAPEADLALQNETVSEAPHKRLPVKQGKDAPSGGKSSEASAADNRRAESFAPAIGPDSSAAESAVAESAVAESALPDTSAPEAPAPEASAPESSVPDTSVPEAPVPSASAREALPEAPPEAPEGELRLEQDAASSRESQPLQNEGAEGPDKTTELGARSTSAMMQPPPPEWLTAPTGKQADGSYRLIVKSGPFKTRIECDKELRTIVAQGVDDYVELLLGQEVIHRAMGNGFRGSTLLKPSELDGLVRQTWLEHGQATYPVGDVVTVHALVVFTPQMQSRIESRFRERVSQRRAGQAAVGSMCLLGLLAIVYGYLRFDMLTRGYYTGRLRLAALAMILAIVGGTAVYFWAFLA